jgi:hypothetical protein
MTDSADCEVPARRIEQVKGIIKQRLGREVRGVYPIEVTWT